MLFGVKSVNAKEVVYTNNNGMELDRYEYDFFRQLYGQKFLQYLDQNVYNQYLDIDFQNPDLEVHTYIEPNFNLGNNPRGSFYSTPAKSINIGKICGAVCRIVTTATWLVDPSVKSYDVIGSYIVGPTRVSTPATSAYSTLDTNLATTTKYDTDGYGGIVELPQGNDIVVVSSFIYTGTGTVYSSYQHAMTTSSTTIAQQFNISGIGFGDVFDFYDDAYDIYDNMNGVYLVV